MSAEELVECPDCYGTGRNRRGGPCKRCRGRARLPEEDAQDAGFFVPTGALVILSPVLALVRGLWRWATRPEQPDE